MPDRERTNNQDISITSIILRVILTSIVVWIAAFFTPGFSIRNLWSLILSAIVIAALNYIIEQFTGIDASPFGRGLTGFIVAGVILYVTKFIVPGFNISVVGAIIGALAIGIIDMIIPGRVF